MTWLRVALYSALFAAGLVYYWSSEPRPDARPETVSKEMVLLDVSADQMTEVHLTRGGRRIRCRREGVGWQVIEPAGAHAPADLIATLVTTLVETRAAELIADEAVGDDPFGLGAEASRLELYQRGHDAPVTVILGGRNPTDTAIYAQVEGSPRVLLVGRILDYYVERVFEEVGEVLGSGANRGVEIERIEHTG